MMWSMGVQGILGEEPEGFDMLQELNLMCVWVGVFCDRVASRGLDLFAQHSSHLLGSKEEADPPVERIQTTPTGALARPLLADSGGKEETLGPGFVQEIP